MSNKLSSVICVGTTRSAHKIGWLTYLRDIPTAGFRMKALVIVLPLTRASNAAHPEEPLDAAAIFSKVQEKYAQGETFSCVGTLTSTQNTVPALKDVRPFRVSFQRPDGIRLEWTDTQFLRGSQTSSIFTEAGKVLAHTPRRGQQVEYASIAQGTRAEAGVSCGITYLIPSLLLGEPGYLT
jgi:hypothetical protein